MKGPIIVPVKDIGKRCLKIGRRRFNNKQDILKLHVHNVFAVFSSHEFRSWRFLSRNGKKSPGRGFSSSAEVFLVVFMIVSSRDYQNFFIKVASSVVIMFIGLLQLISSLTEFKKAKKCTGPNTKAPQTMIFQQQLRKLQIKSNSIANITKNS